MPTVSNRRSIDAASAAIWEIVSDPERLSAWWPGVARVEDATPHAWTTVLTSPRGKQVRADYSRAEFDPPRLMAWRQELEESPFERILREAVTTVRLEPESEIATAVEVTVRQRARGFGRFGYVQLRRAAARQAEEALGSLAALVEPRGL
jgi:uncharacterized protein YndB with AHSA1/START domain